MKRGDSPLSQSSCNYTVTSRLEPNDIFSCSGYNTPAETEKQGHCPGILEYQNSVRWGMAFEKWLWMA